MRLAIAEVFSVAIKLSDVAVFGWYGIGANNVSDQPGFHNSNKQYGSHFLCKGEDII